MADVVETGTKRKASFDEGESAQNQYKRSKSLDTDGVEEDNDYSDVTASGGDDDDSNSTQKAEKGKNSNMNQKDKKDIKDKKDKKVFKKDKKDTKQEERQTSDNEKEGEEGEKDEVVEDREGDTAYMYHQKLKDELMKQLQLEKEMLEREQQEHQQQQQQKQQRLQIEPVKKSAYQRVISGALKLKDKPAAPSASSSSSSALASSRLPFKGATFDGYGLAALANNNKSLSHEFMRKGNADILKGDSASARLDERIKQKSDRYCK